MPFRCGPKVPPGDGHGSSVVRQGEGGCRDGPGCGGAYQDVGVVAELVDAADLGQAAHLGVGDRVEQSVGEAVAVDHLEGPCEQGSYLAVEGFGQGEPGVPG